MSVLELKSWFWYPLAFSFGSTDACLTKADGIKNKIINCFIYQIHIFHISNKFSWKKYPSKLFHSVRSQVHFNPWIEIMNWTDWRWTCLLFALQYYFNRKQHVSKSVQNDEEEKYSFTQYANCSTFYLLYFYEFKYLVSSL